MWAICDNSEFHSERPQHGIYGFVAGMCTHAQRLVKALTAKSCVFGDLRHASCFSHIAECGKKHVGVRVFNGRRKIFGYELVVIEVVGRIKGSVGCFHDYGRAIRRFTHSSTAGSCCAEKSASVMMRS